MNECDKLTGRARDICRGHKDDGTPIAMSAERRQQYLDHWRAAGKLKGEPKAKRKRTCKSCGKRSRPRLTIGMTCRDDFDGVFFTIQSLRIHDAHLMNRCQFVVVDQNPQSAHGKATKAFVESVKGVHVPSKQHDQTAQIFKAATGRHVLCIPSHTVLAPGSLDSLFETFAKHPERRLAYGDGTVIVANRKKWDGIETAADLPGFRWVGRDESHESLPHDTTGDLTIGMATYDDFSGVWFTIQSIRLNDAALSHRFHFVVVDNNPKSEQGKRTKRFVESIGGTYEPFTKRKGSCPPRGHLLNVAPGKYVLCLDAHVLMLPGALQSLLDYYDANPDTINMLHGPLMTGGLTNIVGTHMIPDWRSEMFGRWGKDERGFDVDGEPFEIPMHGLGLFSMRKAAWPGFHPDLDGFSGGEGVIHEHVRQQGGKVLCLPKLRWMHRFQRPGGAPAPPRTADKVRNYLRGWSRLPNLEQNVQAMTDHFVGGHKASHDTPKLAMSQMKKLAKEVGLACEIKPPTPRFRGLVVGPTSYGSFGLRGKPLIAQTDWPAQNTRGRIQVKGTYDVILAVKGYFPEHLHKHAKRLIWDPLDSYFANRREMSMKPTEYWHKCWKRLRFTEIIATSPACAEVMRAGLPDTVKIHMVPHAADNRVGADWYNLDGPIVYAGHRQFVEKYEGVICEACKRIGRKLVFSYEVHSWKSLEGAALQLCIRTPPYNLPLHHYCRPQIKLANSAAAGVPCVATDWESAMSLWPDVMAVTSETFTDVDSAEDCIRIGLEAKPLERHPWIYRDNWLKTMDGILNAN